jgi:hypothetical protein
MEVRSGWWGNKWGRQQPNPQWAARDKGRPADTHAVQGDDVAMDVPPPISGSRNLPKVSDSQDEQYKEQYTQWAVGHHTGSSEQAVEIPRQYRYRM